MTHKPNNPIFKEGGFCYARFYRFVKKHLNNLVGACLFFSGEKWAAIR